MVIPSSPNDASGSLNNTPSMKEPGPVIQRSVSMRSINGGLKFKKKFPKKTDIDIPMPKTLM